MMRNMIVATAILIGVLCLGFIISQDVGDRAVNLSPPAIIVSYATSDF